VLCLLLLLFVSAPWLPNITWLHAAVVLGLVLALALTLAIAVLQCGDFAPCISR
jgi:hypothetical protein